MQLIKPVLILIVLTILACKAETAREKAAAADEKQMEYVTPPPKAPGQAQVNTFKLKSDNRFIVIEKVRSASTSRITIQGMGFPESEEIFSLRDVDPIETGLIEDLDGDGFEELYLVTRSAGSGSYATVYGFASIEDKSYSQISIPEVDTNDPNFAGYQGHERIQIRGDHLVRHFPIYRKGDPNANPSGGSRMIKYALVSGDDGLELVIKEVSNHR